jgi:uncharacterized protein with HEPN domain
MLLPEFGDEIEWKGIKGIRDKLSHHYFDIDSEIIFDICESKLPALEETTQRMIEFVLGDRR